jgi:hypothetical protein
MNAAGEPGAFLVVISAGSGHFTTRNAPGGKVGGVAEGISITAKRRFGQFLITKPADVTLDGLPAGTVGWGGTPAAIAAAPGKHVVTMGFRYLGRQCGKATLEVEVPTGGSVALLYRSPWVVTSKGSLKVQ